MPSGVSVMPSSLAPSLSCGDCMRSQSSGCSVASSLGVSAAISGAVSGRSTALGTFTAWITGAGMAAGTLLSGLSPFLVKAPDVPIRPCTSSIFNKVAEAPSPDSTKGAGPPLNSTVPLPLIAPISARVWLADRFQFPYLVGLSAPAALPLIHNVSFATAAESPSS
ncbi:hypothetical protein D3C75_862270 [compost metagenome]